MSRWMKNFIIIASLLLVSCASPVLPAGATDHTSGVVVVPIANKTVEVTNYLGTALEVFDVANLTLAEQRARQSAVKVRSLTKGGHGSGTYMVAYGRRIVATAAHVVRNETVMAIDGRDGETVVGKVVFIDHDVDLAYLVVPEMETRTAIRYRPVGRYDERMVGTAITYTGFPSHHDLLTIRGYVASLERGMIVSNMFGWFGSSGSGVFDQHGRYLGCVSGIDIGVFGFGNRIPLEDIVWIAPASTIDHSVLKIRITTTPVPTAQSFPGARAPRRGTGRD